MYYPIVQFVAPLHTGGLMWVWSYTTNFIVLCSSIFQKSVLLGKKDTERKTRALSC